MDSLIVENAVFYIDGGASPTNPGIAGSGLHGYSYLAELPKKGAGITTQILTNQGYVAKTFAKENAVTEVTPTAYFDIILPHRELQTNNYAELSAFMYLLEWALTQTALKELTIWTDSRYVDKGFNTFSHKWLTNNFRRSDGGELANEALWRQVVSYGQSLKDRGVNCSIGWVRGHNGDYGNELADRLVGLAKNRASQKQYGVVEQISDPDGYWKKDFERPAILTHRSMYFNTVLPFNEPGVYYTGHHGSEDRYMGARSPEVSVAVTKLLTPEPVLEALRKATCERANGYDYISIAMLDTLYRPAVYSDIRDYGTLAMIPTKHQVGFTTMDNQQLVKIQEPVLLSQQTIQDLEFLEQLLDSYTGLITDPALKRQFHVNDLTEVFYSNTTKPGKKKTDLPITVTTLNGLFTVGVSKHRVVIESIWPPKPDEVLKVKIDLVLGLDLPDRNALKRLEAENPRVLVLTWMESETCVKYATVLTFKNGVSIWCGLHTNLRLL